MFLNPFPVLILLPALSTSSFASLKSSRLNLWKSSQKKIFMTN